MDRIEGQCVLVGHSWGGMVITEVGNDERVSGLVYIAALAPDAAASALPEEDDWTSSEQKALEVLTGRQRVAASLSSLCSWH